jgi:signal transduction histidine kinase
VAKGRILVVDDEPQIVEFCVRTLIRKGYLAQGVTSGEKAIALLGSEPFDLLIVDIQIPDVNGLVILRRGRDLDPNLTAIVITGHATMDRAIEALHLGARGFILKPFGLHEFTTVVDEAMVQREKEQERLHLKAQLPILEISQTLVAENDLESLAKRLLKIVVRQSRAVRALLFLQDEANGRQYVVADIEGKGIDSTQHPADLRIVRRVLLLRKPLVAEVQQPTDLDPSWQLLVPDPGAPVAYVPLHTTNKAIGVLYLRRATGDGPFTPADLNLLSIVSGQIAMALENARLFKQVHTSRERLRRLARQIVSTQEEERRRLSRELHDEAGQALTALKISLELLHADLPAEAQTLSQQLDEAVALTDATMEQIRLLAQDLRPPALDAVGLSPTLEGFCRDFAERTQLDVLYSGAELPVLPDEICIGLYRFLQEALTNVARHARARKAYVSLGYDDGMVNLSVEDDGQGFDIQAVLDAPNQPSSIGLLGMQERLDLLGGELEITSQPGHGTCLVAQIPWREDP